MTALLTAPPAIAPPAPASPAPGAEPYRFSVAQYHAMIAAGILTADDRAELIRGMVVMMMPQNSPHRIVTRQWRRCMSAVVPDSAWSVESQAPITCPDSEPEPDGYVCAQAAASIRGRNPRASEVALVAETADSSLPHDRGAKKAIYAEARIPVYWILNVIENIIEVYTDPSGPGPSPDYATRQDYRPGDEVPVVLVGVEVGRIPVNDLLPPPAGATP